MNRLDTIHQGQETRTLGPNAVREVIATLVGSNTVYAENPSVYYEPFILDGRVGYRVHTNDNGEPRETYVYLNPTTDPDDGMPNVFVYTGGNNDPAQDDAEFHVVLEHLVSPSRMPELCCFSSCGQPATHQIGGDVYFPMCEEHYQENAHHR